MIPTINTIVEDLLAGKITKHQAIEWLNQHAEGAIDELRDAFALAALQGLCADRHHADTQGRPRIMAVMAYECADAMLERRLLERNS